MRWPLRFLVFAAACGGSSPGPTARPAADQPASQPVAQPQLLGKPVWDGPLGDPMALRALERVRGALADAPPALAGADPRMWTAPLQRWIERRVKLARELRADADALASDADPRMQLLAALVIGIANDDLVTDLTSIDMPAEAISGEYGEETRAVFRETLEAQAAPLATSTRTALQRCIAIAPRAPEALRVWTAHCTERDGQLAKLEARVASRAKTSSATAGKPLPRPPAMFADCDSTEVQHVDPVAPPADRSAKPAVAYLYDGSTLKGADVQKVEQAVAAKLGLEVGMPVVDAKELAAARALVGKRKLHAKGPVCGQAPPLPAVIAHTRRHLILGEITTTCIHQSARQQRCGLLVQYSRAGSEDQAGVPEPMFAKVDSLDVPVTEWVAAADRLQRDEGAGGLLGMLMDDRARVFFDVSGFADEDPWLRVASTLNGDTMQRLAECTDAPASFDATFTVSRVGKAGSVALRPVTAPPAASRVTACVKKALEATAWPCTLDGKPAAVSVRVCVAPRPTAQ